MGIGYILPGVATGAAAFGFVLIAGRTRKS
jgi:hypothetical protein